MSREKGYRREAEGEKQRRREAEKERRNEGEKVASSSGKKPASIAKRHTPRLQQSAWKPSYPFPVSTSGAVYDLEPHTSFSVSRTMRPSLLRWYRCASPKSQILHTSP